MTALRGSVTTWVFPAPAQLIVVDRRVYTDLADLAYRITRYAECDPEPSRALVLMAADARRLIAIVEGK